MCQIPSTMYEEYVECEAAMGVVAAGIVAEDGAALVGYANTVAAVAGGGQGRRRRPRGLQ
jgi:hypothetical protein